MRTALGTVEGVAQTMPVLRCTPDIPRELESLLSSMCAPASRSPNNFLCKNMLCFSFTRSHCFPNKFYMTGMHRSYFNWPSAESAESGSISINPQPFRNCSWSWTSVSHLPKTMQKKKGEIWTQVSPVSTKHFRQVTLTKHFRQVTLNWTPLFLQDKTCLYCKSKGINYSPYGQVRKPKKSNQKQAMTSHDQQSHRLTLTKYLLHWTPFLGKLQTGGMQFVLVCEQVIYL